MRGGSRTKASLREPTFASHLAEFYAHDLKRFASVWAGGDAGRLSKGPAQRAILDVLAHPARIREALERLTPFERAALGLVKVHGPVMATDALALELFALGLPRPRFESSIRDYGYGEHQAPLNVLLSRGLVMLRRGRWDSQYAATITGYSTPPFVFCDPAVLAEVEPIPPEPLEIPMASDVAGAIARHEGEVLQRLVAVENAISALGLELTSRGRITKPSAARLEKRLGFGETAGAASTELPRPASFFLRLWLASGLLSDEKQRLDMRPNASAAAVGDLPYSEQARIWVDAYFKMTGWVEYKPPGRYIDEESAEPSDVNALRGALVTAFAALPDPAAWYAIDDLSGALFDRLGGSFSIGGRARFYARVGATPDEVRRERAEWLAKARTAWASQEGKWIAHAFAGPLFHLGLVEFGFGGRSRKPRLFRLTEAGRRAVWEPFRTDASAREVRDRTDEPCWIVQPNFDVVVYLDSVSPRRMRFLERVAERLPAEGVTATYRLTRASVYVALESGVELDEVLETLAQGSRQPLPDNVVRSIADWAGRRDRLTVHRDASLLEFADAAARETALESGGAKGEPVGERFLLLARRARSPRHGRQFDYRYAAHPCVTVTEDGLVTIDPALADLTIRDQLSRWCEPTSGDPNRWRLTRASVGRAVTAGHTTKAILEALSGRSTRPVPAIVRIAVAAWGGVDQGATEIADAVVLTVADPFVAAAVAASETLGAFVERRLGPDAFLVRRGEAARLRAKLEDLGLAASGDAGARPKKRRRTP